MINDTKKKICHRITEILHIVWTQMLIKKIPEMDFSDFFRAALKYLHIKHIKNSGKSILRRYTFFTFFWKFIIWNALNLSENFEFSIFVELGTQWEAVMSLKGRWNPAPPTLSSCLIWWLSEITKWKFYLNVVKNTR